MSIYTPLEPPTSTQLVEDTLSEKQKGQLQEVLARFVDEEYKIPGESDGSLREEEKFWLSYDCFLRYLRASKWVVNNAIQRVEDTLKWRREYDVYERVTAECVEPESMTGKQIIFGYDVNGRPCSHMIPSRENTEESQRQVDFTVWMMERSIDLMGPGVESLCLMINFGDRGKTPSMRIARQVLNIIQSHYPERLGVALIINLPTVVNFFFKLILPFVDPITRNKLKFNPSVFEDGLLTKDMAFKQHWGGDCDFEWDHEKYWPALVKMCEKRRKEQFERWRELGGKVGIKEWDVKIGGAATPLNDVEPVNEAEVATPVVNEKIQDSVTVDASPVEAAQVI